jgi:hypothetical protein
MFEVSWTITETRNRHICGEGGLLLYLKLGDRNHINSLLLNLSAEYLVSTTHSAFYIADTCQVVIRPLVKLNVYLPLIVRCFQSLKETHETVEFTTISDYSACNTRC